LALQIDTEIDCLNRHWNRYPGARVDSTIPHYEFSDPDLFTEWKWSQRFPGSAELPDYFQYVAKKWDLVEDTEFSTLVTGAVWDEVSARWTIYTKSDTNTVYRCQFFLPNTGFAAKPHIPDWKGIDSFRGTWIHSSYWPKEEPDLRDKKIAVIGTGSTGIQLVQDLAPLASEFVLFQRTPNLALPMKQVQYDAHDAQAVSREQYQELFKGRSQSCGGFDFNFLNKNTFDDSEEDRRRTYEDLWSHGDFHYWLATYQDMLFDDRANTEAYEFWYVLPIPLSVAHKGLPLERANKHQHRRDKVRARLPNKSLWEKFAPTKKPHAFGCKRISLENGFYEQFNRPSVHLVDVNETPITEVTPKGIRTSQKGREFDYVVCATGFDAITGGILLMNVQGRKGIRLQDKCKGGVKTFLGLSIGDFPNM
jgi:cation diffusion facilitator CzcD-associated flavoprotein CzcO